MKRFQHFVAQTAFAFLLLAIAVALVAGIGTRLTLWNPAFGQFGVFPYSLYLAVAALVLGLVWAVSAFASGSGDGARYGVGAILASLIIFWIPARDFWMAEVVHSIPPINDISTDSEHAPEFLQPAEIGRAATRVGYDGMRRIKFEGRSYAEEALQRLYYGDIKPVWQLGTTAKKLYKRALSAARQMGWRIVDVAPDGHGGRIQASDTTTLFGVTDDIVIRVEPAGIGARLDIRSRSRDSVSDLGRNAARIRAYIKRLASS
ncbi:MAG TPA: DUF1499 domain-containing protein [Rhizomicrobium sp.]|nr:DUF1499 domain-containing protein [Rhizomicrobium sp.]